MYFASKGLGYKYYSKSLVLFVTAEQICNTSRYEYTVLKSYCFLIVDVSESGIYATHFDLTQRDNKDIQERTVKQTFLKKR